MIKTAEEWRQEPMFKHLRWTPETVCSVIKSIQLNAIKHGMTIAAYEANKLLLSAGNNTWLRVGIVKSNNAILTTRDNLVDIPK